MTIANGHKVVKEVRTILSTKKLPAYSVQMVICDQGLRVDVRSDAINKVRQALPLRIDGIAVIVVP